MYSPEKKRKSSYILYIAIFIAVESIHLLIISIARLNLPPRSDGCSSGRVYVYDLPSTFNYDLLANCTDVDLWNWQCGIAANHGLGLPAAELRRVLPEKLAKSWFRTNQFALELIFHRRILQHKCRTLEAESAAAFYIPFYAGLAVGKYLFGNDTAQRDRPGEELMRWLQRRKHWMKSNGSDHFIAIGRVTWDFRRSVTDVWGSTFLNLPAMKKVTRFIIERSAWDHRDVGVPYPTGFHPKTKRVLEKWQDFVREHNRSSLFTFVGAARPNESDDDFRGLLLSYCSNESSSCLAIDCTAAKCAADYSVSLQPFLGSEFCLQPVGDSATRRSVFDCMVSGSVPVFFWKETAYNQYKWFLPGEPESYSVYISHEEVRNRSSVIKQVLMSYNKEDIRRKREKVIEIIPRIIYGEGSPDFKDAFDIALDGVLERILRKKDRMRKINFW